MPTQDALRERALDLLIAGDTAGGITDLRAYLQGAPDDAGAWLALGTAYVSIDHLGDAVAALRRAAALDPRDVESRISCARALARLGDGEGAAAVLEEAVGIDPENARALRELGVVRYDQRRFDEAAKWLGKAAMAAPGDARASYALGLAEEARNDMGAAVAAYREAVRRDPELTDARRTLADALAGLGEHEAAIAELTAVLRIDRTDEQAAKNREVLAHAQRAMLDARLLGRSVRDLEASALLVTGGFRSRGPVAIEGARVLRWTAPLVEVYATLDAAEAIDALLLVLTDPARAAREDGEAFRVTVIAEGGRRAPADLGTALTLTFLREALGCPLTQASTIYGRLVRGEDAIAWGGAIVGWGSVPKAGIEARRAR